MALIVLRSNRTTKRVNLQPVAIHLRISFAISPRVFLIYAHVCLSTTGIQWIEYAEHKNQMVVHALLQFNVWPIRICTAMELVVFVPTTITGQRMFVVSFNSLYLVRLNWCKFFSITVRKASYGEVCTTCDNTVGLSCNAYNYCVCTNSKFWNGTYCVPSLGPGLSCKNSFQCNATIGLYCDQTTFQCM